MQPLPHAERIANPESLARARTLETPIGEEETASRILPRRPTPSPLRKHPASNSWRAGWKRLASLTTANGECSSFALARRRRSRLGRGGRDSESLASDPPIEASPAQTAPPESQQELKDTSTSRAEQTAARELGSQRCRDTATGFFRSAGGVSAGTGVEMDRPGLMQPT